MSQASKRTTSLTHQSSPVAALLEVEHLTKTFPMRASTGIRRQKEQLKAVDDVALKVERGETLAIVGESGCGKTTLLRCVVRLLRPDAGRILYAGEDLWKLKAKELRRLRRKFQMVFQDPASSLTPRMTIGAILAEPLRVHRLAERSQIYERSSELLELVGLSPTMLTRYPHEFSGGQRQRVAIARALAHQPELLVLDEPTSALDVSIQAQILTLLSRLQADLGLTYLFITHDLATAGYLADRVAVMYLGRIVEIGDAKVVLRKPQHPYTRSLISAVPIPDPVVEKRRTHLIKDGPIGVGTLNTGCLYAPRCEFASDSCLSEVPRLQIQFGREVACLKAAEVDREVLSVAAAGQSDH